ncbi:MAG: hypothetical protein QXT64_00295 [Desulfurococcaceae archaeon]
MDRDKITTIGLVVLALLALVATVFLLIEAVSMLAMGFCAEPQGIPEKWRYADQAIYLLSFPYPTYETVTRNVNGTEIVEVVEKPAEVESITVIMCVWNATEENPVFVSVDRDETKIVREGYYVLTWKPSPGLHSVAVYSEYKIYEVATVKVKPPPPLPWMITWEEFLQKLKEAKEEVIRNLLIASAGGVALGIFLKRKSKIFTYWIPFALAWLNVPPYMNPLEYYPLFGVSVASIIAYWLCPPFARWLGILTVDENAQYLRFSRIPRDPDDGQAILGISPRYVRRWFMLKKRIDVEDPNAVGFELGGEIIETVVATGVEENESSILIHGSNFLARALIDSGLLEKLSEELREARTENYLMKRAGEAVTLLRIKELEEAIDRAGLTESKSWLEAVEKTRRAIKTKAEPPKEGREEGGEAETGEGGGGAAE